MSDNETDKEYSIEEQRVKDMCLLVSSWDINDLDALCDTIDEINNVPEGVRSQLIESLCIFAKKYKYK